MNRELRRLQEREERRMKKQRQRPRPGRGPARERTGLFQFFREVRVELSRVNWPNSQEVTTYTVVTLITTVAITLFTFGLDFAFKEAVLFLLQRS